MSKRKRAVMTDVANAFDVPQLHPAPVLSPIRYACDRCQVTIVKWLDECDCRTKMVGGYLTNVLAVTNTQPEYYGWWMRCGWRGLPLGGTLTDDTEINGLRVQKHTVKVALRRENGNHSVCSQWLVEVHAPGGSVVGKSWHSPRDAMEQAMDRAFWGVMKALPHG